MSGSPEVEPRARTLVRVAGSIPRSAATRDLFASPVGEAVASTVPDREAGLASAPGSIWYHDDASLLAVQAEHDNLRDALEWATPRPRAPLPPG